MKYRVSVVRYPKNPDELIETPHEDEILEASEFLAFLDFMEDQGFRLISEDQHATSIDDLADVTLTYGLM